MGIIAADLFLTLDGVYQAPGGPTEDPSGGFAFGGWQAPFGDEETGAAIMASINRTDALLLGRHTYDIFASYWPFQPMDNPVAAKFAELVLADLARWKDWTVLERLIDGYGKAPFDHDGAKLKIIQFAQVCSKDKSETDQIPVQVAKAKSFLERVEQETPDLIRQTRRTIPLK